MVRGIFAQAILDVGGIACTFQIDAREAERTAQEMNVTIREAGQNKFSAGVDHACADPAHPAYNFVGANGDNFAAANGESLCPWRVLVERVDFRMNNENIGGSRAGGHLRARRNRGNEDRDKDCEGGANSTGDHIHLKMRQPGVNAAGDPRKLNKWAGC